MGDAQFGIHGATAIGWMTLEGAKAQGTDLHSKTASILGTKRDQAKVFNYSRIYGAGIRHAMHLLLKANPSMQVDEAARRAKQLYAATKGQATRGDAYFGRRFWYGGSESFVFNKLEEIALKDDYFISRKLYPNVDFYTGLIYRAMGFPTDFFTVLFAIGRLPGWIAQYREQLAMNSKINRPRQIYTGYTKRDFVPRDQR